MHKMRYVDKISTKCCGEMSRRISCRRSGSRDAEEHLRREDKIVMHLFWRLLDDARLLLVKINSFVLFAMVKWSAIENSRKKTYSKKKKYDYINIYIYIYKRCKNGESLGSLKKYVNTKVKFFFFFCIIIKYIASFQTLYIIYIVFQYSLRFSARNYYKVYSSKIQ